MWKAYRADTRGGEHKRGGNERLNPPVRGLKWEQCLEQIDNDILSGTFGDRGPLPAVKVMQYRYGASHKTVRKALDALRQRGVVARQGARWHVVSESRHVGSDDCVVFVSAGSREGVSRSATPWHFSNVRILERAAGRRNVRVEYMVYSPEARIFVPEIRAIAKKPVLGAICSDASVSYADLCDMVAAIPSRWPTVLVNEPDFTRLPPALKRHPNAAVCRLGSNADSGRAAATYLHSRGHREVVYISPCHNVTWSRNRLAGILELEVPALTVHVETVDDVSDIREYATRFDGLRDEFDNNLMALAGGGHEIGRVELVEALRERLAAAVQSALVPLAWRELFERAYAHVNATAWLCVSDDVALAALRFLASRRRDGRLPIAVMGFDDLTESTRAGLTSFTFEHHRAMETALGLVLSPRNVVQRGARRPRMVSFCGHVVPRKTA